MPKTVEESDDSNQEKIAQKETKHYDKIIDHGLLQHYQIPLLDIRVPKSTNGRLNFNQVAELRDLRLNIRNNCRQKINAVGNSYQFYDDLELDNFFKNQANWTNLPKYTSTNSFLSSIQVYLPDVKIDKEIFEISNEFKEIHLGNY